jgi:hypothetical protein
MMQFFLSKTCGILTPVPQGAINLKQKMRMNYDSKLMKLVPAGVVLSAAVFLGRSQERVYDFNVISILFGYGAVIALMAIAAVDFPRKGRSQSSR